MKINYSGLATLTLLGVPAMASCGNNHDKPNVIIFFIDDMGYGDIAPFGSSISPTPNLTKMASEGVVLEQFYVSSTNSTPSRAALMTGCYANTVGMAGDVVFPIDHRGLSPEEYNLPKMFKSEGYVTGCFGKWHLGDQAESMPIGVGFDEYEGIPYSNDMWPLNTKHDNLPPLPYMKGEEVVAHISNGESQSVLTEATSNASLDFIRRHKDEPFFMYVPYSAVHWPRYARKELVDQHNGDVLATQVTEIDNGVGHVIELLRELNLDDNTFVLFTSDNGGAPGCSMGELRGKKGGVAYEGRNREPTIIWYPKGIKKGGVRRHEIFASKDVLPSLARLIGADISKENPIDGEDQLDVYLGRKRAKSVNDTLFFQFDAVRIDDWKLIKATNGNIELYNIKDDISETQNVAADNADRAAEMLTVLEDFEQRISAKARKPAYYENPKAILTEAEVSQYPHLYEYMGMTEPDAIEAIRPTVNQVKRKKAKK